MLLLFLESIVTISLSLSIKLFRKVFSTVFPPAQQVLTQKLSIEATLSPDDDVVMRDRLD